MDRVNVKIAQRMGCGPGNTRCWVEPHRDPPANHEQPDDERGAAEVGHTRQDVTRRDERGRAIMTQIAVAASRRGVRRRER